jgi:hypothetical protein
MDTESQLDICAESMIRFRIASQPAPVKRGRWCTATKTPISIYGAYRHGSISRVSDEVMPGRASPSFSLSRIKLALRKYTNHDLRFTWPKRLSLYHVADFSGLSEEGDQGYSNTDPHNLRKTKYGNGGNDIRNRFVLQSTSALSFGKEFTGFKRQVASGWQINQIFVIQSGKGFSMENSNAGGCIVPPGFAAPTTGNRAHPL